MEEPGNILSEQESQPEAAQEQTSQVSEEIVDDEWAEFRKLSPEEQKWALIQLQLDREQRYMENIYSSE